ncbi:MAG: type II secretion system protein [Cyanobacteria bacterium SIG32]|nr:type II secretion system protein [Cyanobacteria bacterium SIG32]
MKKDFAFTLAEVLITLAIIGVVAAMTIPTLVANYQEKSWNTAASVFNRNLGESLRMMNVLNELKGLESSEQFVSNLSKYMKVTATCDNTKLTNCFNNEVVWNNETVAVSDIKTAKNLGKDDWGTNVVGLQLANGTSALVAYNPNCDGNVRHITSDNNVGLTTECVAIVFDTSGSKTPNMFGKDLRSVNVSSVAKVEDIDYTSWDYIRNQCGPITNETATNSCINAILATTDEWQDLPYIDDEVTGGGSTSIRCSDGACWIHWEK